MSVVFPGHMSVELREGVENRSHLTVRRNAPRSDGFRFDKVVWSLTLVQEPPLVEETSSLHDEVTRIRCVVTGYEPRWLEVTARSTCHVLRGCSFIA